MTDPLTDPYGAPYPTTVQQFIHHYFPDLAGDAELQLRTDLNHALQAAIVADRGRQPPPPVLDAEHTDRIMRVFLSGVACGAQSALTNNDIPMDASGRYAMFLISQIVHDPAAYATLENGAVTLFTTGVALPEKTIHTYSAHPPRNQKDT